MEEFDTLLQEATRDVEAELKLEDEGWTNLASAGQIVTAAFRKESVLKARLYSLKDPLASRSVKLMTDYTFGTGMMWNCEDEPAKKALESFWGIDDNRPVLSASGQRKSSDNLLIDGEVFFALFMGVDKVVIRRIDPLEITEIISNPDDREDVLYYKREWTNVQNAQKTAYYRSYRNIKDIGAQDSLGANIKATEEALIYHIGINTSAQRGHSYLLPALQWIDLHRQFLAARTAVMLALARFAWKAKVAGGQAVIDAAKAVYSTENIPAGSMAIENTGADLQPIRADSGGSGAYQDGRMLKLQVCAGVGWPEQYFGDISIGNLATAKTVELPVMKMIQSYQSVWSDTYDEIDRVVLTHNNVTSDYYIDRDFPDIAPEAAGDLAASMQMILPFFPELAASEDVMQKALMAMGVNNTDDVIASLSKESTRLSSVVLAKALKRFREDLLKERNIK